MYKKNKTLPISGQMQKISKFEICIEVSKKYLTSTRNSKKLALKLKRWAKILDLTVSAAILFKRFPRLNAKKEFQNILEKRCTSIGTWRISKTFLVFFLQGQPSLGQDYLYNILAPSICMYLCLSGCCSLISRELKEIFEKFKRHLFRNLPP